MDIRFLIVGAPFLIAFFYTLFWLKKWGAFNSTKNNLPKNISLKNESIEQSYIFDNIFLTKNYLKFILFYFLIRHDSNRTVFIFCCFSLRFFPSFNNYSKYIN